MKEPVESPRTLTAEQLSLLTGYERLGDLKRVLNAQGIRYFWGKGGRIWTTIDLVNAAAGLLPSGSTSEPEAYRPEDVL